MNQFGNGLNFGGLKSRDYRITLAHLTAENARRVRCGHCALAILPENMPRHLAIVHDEVAA